MRIIRDDVPTEGGDGSIVFEFGGYVYNIGETDGTRWISRQTIENHTNGTDGWEAPTWHPENERQIKLLRGMEFICKESQ